MNTKKILILVDFSEVSMSLMRYGLALSRHLGAEVWIQYVYYIPPNFAGEVYIPVDALENYKKKVHKQFENLRKEHAEFKNVNFVMNYGDLLTETNRLIEQEDIGLVVMGKKGGGFLTNVLGSNTLKMIEHARCPVLSVPEDIEFEVFHHLALAIDLKDTKSEIFHFLVDFAQAFSSKVDIIHVSEAPVAIDATKLQPAIETAFSDVPHQFFHIHAVDVEKSIEKHMVGNSVDLLVLLPRSHSFFDRLFQKRITRQAAFQSKVPLLSIHI
ncbi:nucleotide-binding universal stress UspA family protein [Catalinimonas alkaloidigena]|uniref:universal stress protein n=1 Tax=Catalinimonas alkaloidigena TaxID=1075417 RepID=UPI002406769C|nr:universal stress protein [Catalinimonas alkaloidigena]MDF9796535.1 nucleotide-binding universal stress UspA family protein [Catalinimonas alkaloidigena]